MTSQKTHSNTLMQHPKKCELSCTYRNACLFSWLSPSVKCWSSLVGKFGSLHLSLSPSRSPHGGWVIKSALTARLDKSTLRLYMAFIISNRDLWTRTSPRKIKASFLRLKTPRNMAISENVWIERKNLRLSRSQWSKVNFSLLCKHSGLFGIN